MTLRFSVAGRKALACIRGPKLEVVETSDRVEKLRFNSWLRDSFLAVCSPSRLSSSAWFIVRHLPSDIMIKEELSIEPATFSIWDTRTKNKNESREVSNKF